MNKEGSLMKTYKTNCDIEYSQEYLPSRDITLIFEDTTVWSKNVNGEPEKFCVRERITGFYHGEPEEKLLQSYLAGGCEAIMSDELIEALTETRGNISKDDVKSSFTYSVIVYGGFDETPLIRYQREYDNKDQALEVYHELEDTFRLEHKIFDNNTEKFIAQEDCSSMAVIKCDPNDDEVISFKSLLYYEDGKTNASYYNEDYRQIVNYLIENCNL